MKNNEAHIFLTITSLFLMQATPKKAVTPNLVKAKPEMKRYLHERIQICSINCDVPYFDSLLLHHLFI
jgi:hypothetical protein